MTEKRWVVRDGMRMLVGSTEWKWWQKNRRNIHGQPPLKRPPEHTEAHRKQQVVGYAHTSLNYQGRMFYTMSARRSGLFGRKPGNFQGASADCSQYCSAILHWVGVKDVTSTDWTGTLLTKGQHLGAPRIGAVAVWGPGEGDHAAFITERAGRDDWWTIGFGHQGAPDRVLLSVMNDYFAKIGKPGVRFLDFLE